MLVAVYCYCGSGASDSGGGIPYWHWLAHVKAEGGEGGATKYKATRSFKSAGVSFARNQLAIIELEQLDFKKADRQPRQQHTRMEAVQTVRPTSMPPVQISECD
jgi:hypothetical protein